MLKRFTVCILTMLSITCGAALAAQLTPAQKIDRVTTLLKAGSGGSLNCASDLDVLVSNAGI